MAPADQPKPPGQKTGSLNGRLWAERAQDWAGIQEVQFAAGYRDVFARVGLARGMRYCDVGCGSGMAAELASREGAVVFGLDAAEGLLDIARQRVPGGEFHLGDMETLPFPTASFDLVTGFNSFQYAANPAVALTEAKRVAKPGGKVVVMTWGPPEGMEAASLVAALRPLLPPPPPGAPGPFALSDERALRDFVEQAGLIVREVIDVDCTWSYPDLKTALLGLGSSGVASRARGNSSAKEVDDAHARALEPFLQPNGAYRIRASLRSVVANG